MDLDLSGKMAIVCGSTQGLGYASAQEIASLGASITLIARNEEKLRTATASLDVSRGQRHRYLVADFQKPDSLAQALHMYGPEGLSAQILVNNTGGPKPGPLSEARENELIEAFQSHVICNHILLQSVLPFMKQTQYGRIVNIISYSVKEPIPGLGVSNTIRGAVASWAKTLAEELGPFGITVNNVLPGLMKTPRYEALVEHKTKAGGKSHSEVEAALLSDIPVGRIGDPREFGAAVAFLCSKSASYINGINLPVDGGKIHSL